MAEFLVAEATVISREIGVEEVVVVKTMELNYLTPLAGQDCCRWDYSLLVLARTGRSVAKGRV